MVLRRRPRAAAGGSSSSRRPQPQQQTPTAYGNVGMLPLLLLLLLGRTLAFLPPVGSPAPPALQGWQALARYYQLEGGFLQEEGCGWKGGREQQWQWQRQQQQRGGLSRLAAGKGFGKKNVDKGTSGGGGGDGAKKKQQPESSATSGGSSGQAGGGVARPALGETVQTPEGEVPRKFQMLYTCNICDGRNLITVDRIAFTEGIVVAKCKHCDAKHLVADNLSKLDFGKGKVTLEDVLALRGEKAERLDVSQNPDLAKYDLQYKEDGTVELMPKEGEEGKEEGGA